MSLSDLPVHLLEEIFTKLRVKPLIILTSVCKPWLLLITSQSFVQFHLSRYQLNPDNHLLLTHIPHNDLIFISSLNTLIPRSENMIRRSNGPFRPFLHETVGSINGLVCVSRLRENPTNVVVWNPATRRIKEILLPCPNNRTPFQVHIDFGFNCVVNDYKIVCIYIFGLRSNLSCWFHMYSCNDDSWKELRHDILGQLRIIDQVTVKGNPYWMCECEQHKVIWVKVDVETDVIKMFSGVERPRINASTLACIMALGDSVAQAFYSPGAETNDMIHVYTLEENSGVWMRMYNIESIGLHGLQMPLRFKCYRKGKLVLVMGDWKKLFMYDLKSKEIKDLMVTEDMNEYYMPIDYTESLVAIEGMVSVPKKAAKEERQETALTAADRDA